MKANILVTIPYRLKEDTKVGIESISLLKNGEDKYLDIIFRLNIEITSIKLILGTFSKDETELEKTEIEIKDENLVREGEITKYRLKVDSLTSYGGIYISEVIDKMLNPLYDLGMYSFASRERIAYEAKLMYEGGNVPREYFSVTPHIEEKEEVIEETKVIEEGKFVVNSKFKIATIILFIAAILVAIIYVLVMVLGNRSLGWN